MVSFSHEGNHRQGRTPRDSEATSRRGGPSTGRGRGQRVRCRAACRAACRGRGARGQWRSACHPGDRHQDRRYARACALREPPARSRPALLVDTSVAVALTVADHEDHEATIAAVGGRRLGLSGHAVFETFSVLTRLPTPARRSAAVVTGLLVNIRVGAGSCAPSSTTTRTCLLFPPLGASILRSGRKPRLETWGRKKLHVSPAECPQKR